MVACDVITHNVAAGDIVAEGCDVTIHKAAAFDVITAQIGDVAEILAAEVICDVTTSSVTTHDDVGASGDITKSRWSRRFRNSLDTKTFTVHILHSRNAYCVPYIECAQHCTWYLCTRSIGKARVHSSGRLWYLCALFLTLHGLRDSHWHGTSPPSSLPWSA